MYFFGTFEHSIDERGRLAIPARYRRAFVDGGVLRPSPDGALELYTYQSFDSEATRRIESGNGNRERSSRRTRRSFLHDSYSVELDKQGRILIPQILRESGSLENRCTLVGCGDYVEIWDPNLWENELTSMPQDE
ncbi:MAG: cell division/cell wall cluster transcriptional repressor MraZ [Dehalococcoidia bacterium]|nr:cell division/cell wall cluster transcriptional repressor MraZ [Dehalococcoidia bacterium]